MNKALTLLNEKGLRATVARLQLLSVMEDSGRERLTAEQIFMRVAGEGGSLSLATVYRVLKELSRHGLVERGWCKDGLEIRLLFSAVQGDAGRDEPQIVCVACNRRSVLAMPALRAELNRLAEPAGLQPEWRPVVIQVICPECAGKP